MLNKLLILFLPIIGLAQKAGEAKWYKKENGNFPVFYVEHDKNISNTLAEYLTSGEKTITKFFQSKFKEQTEVYVFPERKLLDKQWQTAWSDTSFHSQCWMVASGVAKRMDVLSPSLWSDEKCEHNGNNTEEVAEIIKHELVHCFHGQYNPFPDFSGAEDMDWFIEGLATYVSGQLNNSRINSLKKQVSDGKLPNQLKDIWKGSNKYGLAGSMVQYIELKYGKKAVIDLLPFTKTEKVLEYLKITEPELMADWKKHVENLK